MILGVLIILLVLVAGGAVAVSAQGIDPDPTNNEATVSLIADPLLIILNGTGNMAVGGGSSILSPSQTQDPNQAQSQVQTSNNSNSNSLTNTNTNMQSVLQLQLIPTPYQT